MTRVSSNWTLMLKIFIPTVWIVFFGSLTIFFTVLNGLGEFTIPLPAKAIIVGLFFIGILLLYISLLKLKRVEMDESYFYVTNYFKTYRYTYDSLKSISENNYLFFTIVVFRFQERSSFGKRIFFLRRSKIWSEFIDEHPDLFAHLLET